MQQTQPLPGGLAPLASSFVPKTLCSKTLVSFSRFRNYLGQVRSSFSSQDMAKKVIAIANWPRMRDHSSRAVKVDAQITQFGSELSKMWSIWTVWVLESKIGPHFVNFMPFLCLHSPLTRFRANWVLRNKKCNGPSPFQGA